MKKLILLIILFPFIAYSQSEKNLKQVTHLYWDLSDNFGEIVKSETYSLYEKLFDREGYATEELSYYAAHSKERHQFLINITYIPVRIKYTYENRRIKRLDYFHRNATNNELFQRVTYEYNDDGDTILIKTYGNIPEVSESGELFNYPDYISQSSFKYDKKKRIIEKKTKDTDGKTSVKTYKYDKNGDITMTYINHHNEKTINKFNKQGDLIEMLDYYDDATISEREIYKYQYNKLDSVISKIILVYDSYNPENLDSSDCDTIYYLYDKIGNKIEYNNSCNPTTIVKNKKGIFEKVICSYNKSFSSTSNIQRWKKTGYNRTATHLEYQYEKGKLISKSVRNIEYDSRYICIDSLSCDTTLKLSNCCDSVIIDSVLVGGYNSYNSSYDLEDGYWTYKYNNSNELLEEMFYEYDNYKVPYKDFSLPNVNEYVSLKNKIKYEYRFNNNKIINKTTKYRGEFLEPYRLIETEYIYYE